MITPVNEGTKQQPIDYADIKAAEFEEIVTYDEQFFNEYGYPYVIFNLKLTKRIYLEWEQPTRLCSLVRTNKKSDILAVYLVKDLAEMHTLIKFFTADKNPDGLIFREDFNNNQSCIA
jgi:hypothetical protein